MGTPFFKWERHSIKWERQVNRNAVWGGMGWSGVVLLPSSFPTSYGAAEHLIARSHMKWNHEESKVRYARDRSQTEVESRRSRREIGVKPKWIWSDVGDASKWNQLEIREKPKVKPKWQRSEIKVSWRTLPSDMYQHEIKAKSKGSQCNHKMIMNSVLERSGFYRKPKRSSS